MKLNEFMIKWYTKSGTVLQFTIYLVMMALLWLQAFVHPVPVITTQSDGPLYSWLIKLVEGSEMAPVTLALLLVFLQSFSLFYVFQSNGFFGRSNFLPALIAMLAFSWNPDFLTLHPVLLSGLFLIITLNALLTMYGKQASYHQVFTASFALAIASLFWFPIIYLLPAIWFALFAYRISAWREYVIVLIGFVLPYIYFFSWMYWEDSLWIGLARFNSILFILEIAPRFAFVPMLWLSFSAFLLIIAVITVLNALNDKLISLRRKAWVFFILAIVPVFVFLFTGWPYLSGNYLFIISLSFFLTACISFVKRSFWFELILLISLLAYGVMRFYMALLA